MHDAWDRRTFVRYDELGHRTPLGLYPDPPRPERGRLGRDNDRRHLVLGRRQLAKDCAPPLARAARSFPDGFARRGYFLHDANWEGIGQYGPGSENGSGASHGCVHIPTPVMGWLYGWAGIGTSVNIS